MFCSMSRVCSYVVVSTITFWKRLSSAPSFSIISRNSSSVVAPIHWISPRERAGLSRFAASNDPIAPPAPTKVCISSMNRMIFGFSFSSLIIDLILSSNWPRNLVPATIDPMSSETILLLSSALDIFFFAILMASPSTIADLPTPGSPMRIGLFFLLRQRICARRSISFSRPTTGSSLSSSAALVRSKL